MKKLIIVAIFFAALFLLTVPVYADYCDDIAQSYQPMIDRQTITTRNLLAARGISTNEGVGLQELNNALQPIYAQMNLAISECKVEQARTNAGLNNQQNNNPPPSQNNYYIYVAPTVAPQPTATSQVFQIIVTATPTPTPIKNKAYSTFAPTSVIYDKPTPEVSPTATPSSTPTPLPIEKPTQQGFNFFQNIFIFIQNIFRKVFH